jgi:outer membrane protein insertion porin family
MVLCLVSRPVFALDAVRVLVLPFEINAREGFESLQQKLPETLKIFLEQEGATVVDSGIKPGDPWPPAVKAASGMRGFGAELGADYVIWGSLTQAGQQVSIDAKMLSTLTKDPPMVFFEEGRGVEELSLTLKKLVRSFAVKIFKQERVARIDIKGNKRIESDAILKIIETKPGDVFLAQSLSKDLKTVYQMGYFEDIRIESEEGPDGKIVIFYVTEKPTIRRIDVTGNRVYDDEEVLETLNIKRGAILNVYAIRSNVQRIESLYKDKNYHNVKVSYKINPVDNNQADLEFVVEEGEKVKIKTIEFIGNSAYSADDLKDLLKTSEKGFWSWITASGELKKEDLNQDVTRLMAFYHNNGYIEARVGEPEVRYEGSWIFITIKIEEGPQYKVGTVSFNPMDGPLVRKDTELLKDLKITQTKFYSREVARNDTLKLQDIYSDEGYAYADIAPRMEKSGETVVNLIFDIKKGKRVRFEKIEITGNTKTRDKVIRRELQIYEKDYFSGVGLKRGIRNLNRLDFFEDIKVNQSEGSTDDQMNVNIDVKEKPTGTFSFGGGYSSTENLFVTGSISERNLFGLGQLLQFRADIGGTTTRFNINFTEPWLFDIPLSARVDLYKWDRDYDTYTKESVGGSVQFGYPVFDYVRFYLGYRYDISDIRDITLDASKDVWELRGENTTSSVTGTLVYDSRDRNFNPTEGGKHSLMLEYAGLGGDIAFTKVVADAGQYFPLFWDTVGYLHGEGGYVTENSGGILPDYEKFYLGGINSVRGFDWQDICLLDEDGATVGGYKYIQFNVEYIFPLLKDAGVVGVLFFDTGQVFDENESIDLSNLRESAGGGFRWYSPMGPMRIEYGYILDREDDEDSGRWEFSVGGGF